MSNILQVLPVLLMCLLCACTPGTVAKAPAAEWVSTRLAQCWSSPWQQQWQKDPANASGTYPKGQPAELTIINNYYADDGIVVSDSTIKSEAIIACAACGCPNGETMYLYVRQEDVEVMLKNGFKLEAPADNELPRY